MTSLLPQYSEISSNAVSEDDSEAYSAFLLEILQKADRGEFTGIHNKEEALLCLIQNGNLGIQLDAHIPVWNIIARIKNKFHARKLAEMEEESPLIREISAALDNIAKDNNLYEKLVRIADGCKEF